MIQTAVSEVGDDVEQLPNPGSKSKKESKKVPKSSAKKLSKTATAAAADLSATEIDSASSQDQGFCRPRVLILCPFRGAAKSCVDMLEGILGPNTTVSSLPKFEEEFGDDGSDGDSDDGSDEDGDSLKDGTGKRGAAAKKTRRPQDWRALFKQNVDDDFKMGIQVSWHEISKKKFVFRSTR